MSRGLLEFCESVRPVSTLWQDFRQDNTCVLIVDMQKDFLDEGAPVEIAHGRTIIPHVAKLLAVAREYGLKIIHVVTQHPADGLTVPQFSTSPKWQVLKERGLREGTEGVLEVEPLRPVAGEYTVYKRRYSGFFCTDLELLLSLLHVKNLIIGGVATNYCVRSTVHDAYFRGYRPVVPVECAASHTIEEHEASLKDIVVGFGYVTSLDELIRQIRTTWKPKTFATQT